ncbi:heme NO-binding domain-containing protein [Paracoccus sp. Z330]|uniref:Heme NO-binding domain-containing protein n=1 Tax=Paracoccus onchidii TaxID=3017813 RepID=A0ABT4ZDZ5_9RHOB|nr:heme NO-binding domain-containing protein [Paracoccus onchidii]MDB6176956.1 heme NO-binding domain-containing protein [Paracoccus onchidii]
MQQLIIRAIEEFLRQTYGEKLWLRAVDRGMEHDRRSIDLASAAPKGLSVERLVTCAAIELDKSPQELMEDGGAWLARREAFRRLLRFSGRDFKDFLLSLEELPGRAHFVAPDLAMPDISVSLCADGEFTLRLPEGTWGWAPLLGGVVRAMADDYGALGLIAVEGNVITVKIPEAEFSPGRDFNLTSCLPVRIAGEP